MRNFQKMADKMAFIAAGREPYFYEILWSAAFNIYSVCKNITYIKIGPLIDHYV